ncbi:ATP synthase subunit delta [Iodidimonas gelatinilytica]|uniref:ATP synthase subunit delta n=1 Tax=Iodidimonas gelatinilytica TaxID=1236966 RepID=A0A5A7MZG1_9PROT|nr:F0F1 ATP synthase subunit delta [Iodidimonas gelatinilytica]GEQ98699.1 ATP synthase subunit delta [Iodidimonas gelatinilytica]GER00845.1 ATP synthase subunit delta [Iodidimonas gelatinilytica]
MPAEKAIVSGLSGRYATALFELAQAQDALDTVESDLSKLKALMADGADIAAMVASPVLTRTQQGAMVASLAKPLGLSPLTMKFLGVLAQNRRLNTLAPAIRDFAALQAAHKGEVTADIRSARALTKTQMTALEAKLKSIAGRDVAINADVDPSLIGGLVIKLGSRMIDGSIATKLDSLERAMKGV